MLELVDLHGGVRAIWVDHGGDGRFSTEADHMVRSLDEQPLGRDAFVGPSLAEPWVR